MPGKVIKINVKKGDKVKKGTALFILDSMKMEHTIRALSDAVVKEVRVKEGTEVKAHLPIIELE